MTEDEMKNRISMALKEPILQQGFEIICKENTELKTQKIPQLERKIASIRGAHSVDCKKLKARTEQVERLKKENAELRKQVSAMSKALVLNVSEADEKLNRAKEIIKELLDTQSQLDPYRDIFKARILKAEEFLKEVSE